MKIFAFFLFLVSSILAAQPAKLFRKGNAVYVESSSKNPNVQETEQAFIDHLRESGFWTITSSKQQANYIIKLDVETSKGIRLTSWDGTSADCSAKIYDKNDAVVWESDTYKASPNGTNGFNAKKAVARKLANPIEQKIK